MGLPSSHIFIDQNPTSRKRQLSAHARFELLQVADRHLMEAKFLWINGTKYIVRRGMTDTVLQCSQKAARASKRGRGLK